MTQFTIHDFLFTNIINDRGGITTSFKKGQLKNVRPRGMEWGGRREEGSGWGTYVNLWRIHFDIWQI